MCTNFAQRLSYAIPGDAAADREYLGSKGEDFLTYVCGNELFGEMPLQIQHDARDPFCSAPSASRKRSKWPSMRLRRGAVVECDRNLPLRMLFANGF